jgi:hypothetical protein
VLCCAVLCCAVQVAALLRWVGRCGSALAYYWLTTGVIYKLQAWLV